MYLYVRSAAVAPVTASITAAAQASPSAAEIAQKVGETELHAAAAVKCPGITVGTLALLIPAAAVLQTLEQHLILHVLRIKTDRFFRVFQSSHVISQTGVCRCTVKIPERSSFFYTVQDIEGLIIVAAPDIIGSSLKMDLILALTAPLGRSSGSVSAISSEPAKQIASKTAEWSVITVSPLAAGAPIAAGG